MSGTLWLLTGVAITVAAYYTATVIDRYKRRRRAEAAIGQAVTELAAAYAALQAEIGTVLEPPIRRLIAGVAVVLDEARDLGLLPR